MHRALETLGIRPGQKVSINILLSETFNGTLYGMGEEQMARVKALRDIVSEYESARRKTVRKVVCSADAVALVGSSFGSLGHEEVWVAFLNGANAVLSVERMFTGSVSETTFGCREIVARALSSNATGIIIYHNHPSGNPSPSASDIRRTEELRNACRTVDLNLVDHIIVSARSWYSFADESETQFDR